MMEKAKKVKGRIRIEEEQCKACGYCVEHCPQKVIRPAEHYNAKGYFPATADGEKCTGCGICAIVCPEAIIEVWRD